MTWRVHKGQLSHQPLRNLRDPAAVPDPIGPVSCADPDLLLREMQRRIDAEYEPILKEFTA